MQLQVVKQLTQKMVDEFKAVCKQYKNDYLIISNDHEALADDLISLLTQFKEKPVEDKDALMHFFVLVAFVSDFNFYLQQQESTKFKEKLQSFMRKYNVPFLFDASINPELHGLFSWGHKDTSISGGAYWASLNSKEHTAPNLFTRVYDYIKKGIEEHIKSINTLFGFNMRDYKPKTIASYYNGNDGLLDRWCNTLAPLDAFIREHKGLYAQAKNGRFSFFRNTKLDENFTESFDFYITHAQASNNRSRQAFVNLGWMDKDGVLTDEGNQANQNNANFNNGH